MAPTPVTIVTGFLGSGKTTLILNLLSQLPQSYKVLLSFKPPSFLPKIRLPSQSFLLERYFQAIAYPDHSQVQLALLKNEFGDLAVDSQLARSSSVAGVREILHGCVCCNLVGQLSTALLDLRNEIVPDRIVIETSGSAFPATLAMEVGRLAREHEGCFVLDGVIAVIDVENWKGYEDTSFTAKLQARYTDLIVFNKWEEVGERRWEECLDRLGDIELQTAWVRSRRGWVDVDVVLGTDGALVAKEVVAVAKNSNAQVHDHGPGRGREHGHGDEGVNGHDHQSEVEVLAVTVEAQIGEGTVDIDAFEQLLITAPKDEVYRIKGLLLLTRAPPDSSGGRSASTTEAETPYVLNWAFGRWTYTAVPLSESNAMNGAVARLTFILARGESAKWTKKLKAGGLLAVDGQKTRGKLTVEKIG